MKRCRSLLFLLVGGAIGVVLAPSLLLFGDDLLHQDLTYYVDEHGERRPIRTVDDWERRRRQILDGLQLATGPVPPSDHLPPPSAEILSERKLPHAVERLIRIRVEPGDTVPALLYVPQGGNGPYPAVLALHPTGASGKRIIAGDAPRENRQYGNELSERGYVVLCPDYPSFGDSADYDFDADAYASGTMKGIFNHVRCVDYLQSIPEVNAERIGAIGHSLGGHNAIFVGVFDPRLKVIVSSCGWTPFHDYYEGNIVGWTSPRYMPRLRDAYGLDPDRVPFDFYELAAALAPRGFYSSSPLWDSNFDFRGVEKAAPKVRQVYALYGAAQNLRIHYPDCDHDFPAEVREECYRFIDRFLKQ